MAYKEIIELIDEADNRIAEVKRQLEVTTKTYAL